MGKAKHGTPDGLDYLFERDIIDEEDYADFWESYWRKRSEHGRNEIIEFYLELAGESNQLEIAAGVVTKFKSDANRQKRIFEDSGLEARVVRRTKSGRFSKRGNYYQAIRTGRIKK